MVGILYLRGPPSSPPIAGRLLTTIIAIATNAKVQKIVTEKASDPGSTSNFFPLAV